MTSDFRLSSKNFLLICISNFLYFGSFYLLLPTLPQYVANLGGSASQIGTVMGTFTLVSVFVRPYLARLADIHGRKRFMLLGAGAFALLFAFYGFIQSMIPLYLLRLAHGVAHGSFLGASFAYIADLAPVDRRGEVIGVYATSNVVAMALFPGVGIWLLNYVNGNFLVLFTVSVITGAVGFFAIVLMDEVKPLGGRAETIKFSTVIRRRAVWVSSVALFSGATVYGAVATFLPVYAPERGLKNFGIYFTALAVSILISRVVTGKLSDRIGRRKVVLPFMTVLTVAAFLLPFLNSLFMLVLIGVCFGLGFGAYMPTLNALVVDETPPKERGSAIALFTASMDVGITTGSIVFGIVADYWGYAVMFTLGGFVVLAGLLFFALSTGIGQVKT
jgi:MFS family permease